MSWVQCTGREESLADCSHESPVTNCLPWEGAEVTCEQFDHAPIPAPTQTPDSCSSICLKGGSGPHEGNLFVRNLPVCDDDWGMEEAEVACHQLGFPGALNFTRQSKFGPVGTRQYSMDNVHCTGTEGSLQSCRHSSTDDCGDREGAGVVCLPATLAPSPSPPRAVLCNLTVHSGQWANSDRDNQFHMRNILYDDCDSFSWHPNTATYWLAPSRTAASIVLDLGCTQVINGLTLKNTRNAHENNRGLKQFIVFLSNSTSGPWREVLSGELPDATIGNSTCNVPLNLFELNMTMSEEEKTGRAVKLEVISWYGSGAGLQYLALDSHPPSASHRLLVGVMLLLAAVLGLAGLGWRRRHQIKVYTSSLATHGRVTYRPARLSTQSSIVSQQPILN
jgi:hypothetical protein